MPTEAEKRAATLAVSRFGADRQRVQAVFQTFAQARAQGQPADLLDQLVGQKLLTPQQARELRLALDATQIDPSVQPPPRPAPPRSATQATATPDAAADDPLQEINQLGDYRIVRRIGVGGMGAVYLADDEKRGGQVAIKVLADGLASNQSYVDRFYREAKSGALLNHPNVVRGLAVGQDRATGKHYLVMEYVDGPSAHTLLGQHGRLSVPDAVHVVLDVARALEHAHSRNVVHRDIKPDNILVTRTGVAKLADLGLAKRTDEASHLTAARQGFGTPYYMPYEQAVNARHADGRSDIYALGATLYHLVTGEVPFPGENHLEVVDKKERGDFTPAGIVNAGVPTVLDQILEKMLARYPQHRYQTASELIVDLERSHLAAPVPSFVDEAVALQDPTVRARLTAPAQPTRPDVDAQAHAKGKVNGEADLWHLRYRGREGRWYKTKATTPQLVQRIREGRVPAEAEASRHSHDGFRPVSSYPELRVLDAKTVKFRMDKKPRPSEKALAKPAPPEPPTLVSPPRRRWWLLVGAAGLVGVGGGIALLCKLFANGT